MKRGPVTSGPGAHATEPAAREGAHRDGAAHPGGARPPSGLAPRHVAGILAGIAALGVMLAVPPPAPITETGMARLGLLAFAVIWWVATPLPLPLTTLAVLACGVATGALSLDDAFSHSSAWVLWFAIGAFGLGAALEATGVNRRFALAFLDVPWARGRPRRFLMMFLLSATAMSAVMANTVVAVIWLSLAVKIYELMHVSPTDPLVEANTLGIAWAANMGGIATPVGNGTNAAAIGLIASATGVTVTFLQWTVIGSVLTVLFLGVALLMFTFVVPDGSSGAPSAGSSGSAPGGAAGFQRNSAAAYISEERRRLGPMPAAEKLAIGWFVVAIVLWFVPDAARYVASPETFAMLQRNLHLTVPALLVPIAMCLTPVPARTRSRNRARGRSVVAQDLPPSPPGERGGRGGEGDEFERAGVSGASTDRERRFVLTWQEWAKGVDWGLVVFIGGVMGLGTAVGATETGIPAYVQATLQPWLGQLSEYTFVLLLCFGVILVTSLISNMVTLAIFLPLGMTLSQSLQIADPVALGIVLGIGPSLDYLLPSGTTTNAIVAGSGYLRISTMVRYGVVMFLLNVLILTFVGYPLCKLVLGR